MLLKSLKVGDFFILKPILEPRDSQIFIKGDFDRTSKKYFCMRFSDFSVERLLKPDTVVYTDFIF